MTDDIESYLRAQEREVRVALLFGAVLGAVLGTPIVFALGRLCV